MRQSHDTELCFYYVLRGAVTVELDGGPQVLAADDSIAIPGGMTYALADASADLTLLDITLPGDVGEIGPNDRDTGYRSAAHGHAARSLRTRRRG